MSKKSRKLIRQAQATKADAPEPETPVETANAVERDFFFLPDTPAEPADEKELHSLMKEWRHGRATRSLWDVLQDGYVVVFSVLMVSAMVINLVLSAQSTIAQCSSVTCLTARTLVPWAVLAGAFAVTLLVSRLFGPVLASAAEGFWLMDAPIQRSRLLLGRMIGAIVGAGVAAALVGALVSALTGSSPVGVAVWAAAMGLGAAGLTAFAAAEQGAERTTFVKLVQGLFSALAMIAMLLVVSIAAGWITLGLPVELGIQLAAVVGGLGLLMLAGAVFVAVRRLSQIRRARLLSGGSLVSGMQGAMFALDLGLVRDILVDREAIERGHVKPAGGKGVGLAALVWRDVQRLRRFPKPLIGYVMSAVVPYAVDALGLGVLNPLISGVVLVAVLVPFMGSLRVLSRTGGLARLLPFKTTQVRTATMMIPAILALIWAAVATPAFIGISSTGAEKSLTDGLAIAAVTGVAGVLGAVRWVTAKPVDFGTPMMATSAGAVPPTLIFNLFRGFDIVAIVTAPLFWNAPIWSAALATVCFVILRGTFNMDDLKAEQEAAQRQQEAAKQQAGEKVRIQRPQR